MRALSPKTRHDCSRCRDTGYVLLCPEFIKTRGQCCRPDHVRKACPGHSVPCPECTMAYQASPGGLIVGVGSILAVTFLAFCQAVITLSALAYWFPDWP